MSNGRPVKLITHEGRTMSYAEWSAVLGWSHVTLRKVMAETGKLPAPRAFRGVAKDGSWDEDDEARRLVEERGPMTLQEIADHMGVTRERVRQLEGSALRKLRLRSPPHLAEALEELDDLRAERERRGATGRVA